MFERFTDRARRVLVLAQEEARLLNHNFLKRFWERYGEIYEETHGVPLEPHQKRTVVLNVRVGDTREQAMEAAGRRIDPANMVQITVGRRAARRPSAAAAARR